MGRPLVLCAYDVSAADRLAAALHRVTGWSHGGQRSTFECFAAPQDAAALAAEVGTALAAAADRLALLRPEPRASFTLGLGRIARDAALLYVG